MRATCNGIAGSVGFRFRIDSGGLKAGHENRGRETYARNHGDFERGCAGTRSVFPGVFGALRVRRTHVLKKRNVGSSSAKFSRGGKTAFWNSARRSHILRLRGGTGVARGRVARRATRVDLGGRAIRWNSQEGRPRIRRGGQEVRQEPDLLDCGSPATYLWASSRPRSTPSSRPIRRRPQPGVAPQPNTRPASGSGVLHHQGCGDERWGS